MGDYNQRPMRCRQLEIPGATNVRDLGGYVGEGGKPVRYGVFLRAGAMNKLTDAGVAAVRSLGVGCIVDLRSNFELQRMPDTLMHDGEIDFVHVPLLDYINSSLAGGGKPVFPDSMTEMYVGLLENDQSHFLRVMEVMGDPRYGTVLFHCTAGKDRTGLTAMLLLGLAGVSREDIVEDYSYSERFQQQALGNNPDLPRHVFESHPQTMHDALDHLERRYGGVGQYLAHIGVDDGLRNRLLEKLL